MTPADEERAAVVAWPDRSRHGNHLVQPDPKKRPTLTDDDHRAKATGKERGE